MEEVIVDEARGFGSAVSVIDADEDGVGAGLHLALIFDHFVGLHDGEGELPAGVLLEIAVPHEHVAGGGGVVEVILAHTRISPHRSQACRHYPCQPRKHPTFPSLRDPQNKNTKNPEREGCGN